jgi:hypothetical protein
VLSEQHVAYRTLSLLEDFLWEYWERVVVLVVKSENFASSCRSYKVGRLAVILAWMQAFIYTYIPTYILTYIRTYKCTYVHIYIHVYIHACILWRGFYLTVAFVSMIVVPASGYAAVDEAWQEWKKMVFHYRLSCIVRDHNKMEILRSYSRSRGSRLCGSET